VTEQRDDSRRGPLSGIRIIEVGGLVPVSLAGMILGDMGADVIRLDAVTALRAIDFGDPTRDLVRRNRRSVAVDLKDERGAQLARELIANADAVIEGFRPGVLERLGLGPDACLATNPRLVYARLTGWGQDGPLATTVGHDLGYVALSGILPHVAGEGNPMPTFNWVGDFAGGSMFLVTGVLAALLEARHSGRGQVVDAAMVDGINVFTAHTRVMHESGFFDFTEHGNNMLDGGAPFYRTYGTSDGRWVSLAAIESPFYAALLRLLQRDSDTWQPQWDRTQWPRRTRELTDLFRSRTRAEWDDLLLGTDACYAPVLEFDEATSHPHHRARGSHQTVDGQVHPAPAPRFSRTPADIRRGPAAPGADTTAVLTELGLSQNDVQALVDAGVVRQAPLS
jgi:alpha-methylacyl-CoA racemase